MPNNLKKINQKYDKLKRIQSFSTENKSVLIIGGGYMGKEYARALEKLGISDVTIISKSQKIKRQPPRVKLATRLDFIPCIALIRTRRLGG